PANSKQALISFNHDKGIWEAVGSMTVSADGKMICTDPDSGILQPGWHGVGPTPDSPPPKPKDPPKCKNTGSDVSDCITTCEVLHFNCKKKFQDLFYQEIKICNSLSAKGLK